MEYTTIQKTADRWGISKARVHLLCQEGRIPGAVYENKHWRVPIDAQRPCGKGPAGTVSASRMAKKWGISTHKMVQMCALGEIPGVMYDGRYWYVPEDAVNPMEEYISVCQAAEKWGMNRVKVSEFCKTGRIPGAKRRGRNWIIPANAAKPSNRKTERLPGYISATKTAQKWGVSRTYVCKSAQNGRILGAKMVDGTWHIPENAEKPEDMRGRKNRKF